MVKESNRRRFLATVGAGSLAFAAGCADQLPGGNSDGNNGNGDDGLLNGNDDERDAMPPAIDHGEVVSDFDADLDE